jgi:hypothetical protein
VDPSLAPSLDLASADPYPVNSGAIALHLGKDTAVSTCLEVVYSSTSAANLEGRAHCGWEEVSRVARIVQAAVVVIDVDVVVDVHRSSSLGLLVETRPRTGLP